MWHTRAGCIAIWIPAAVSQTTILSTHTTNGVSSLVSMWKWSQLFWNKKDKNPTHHDVAVKKKKKCRRSRCYILETRQVVAPATYSLAQWYQGLGLRNVLIFFMDENNEYFCLLISRRASRCCYQPCCCVMGNWEDAVGVNSRYVTSVVATSLSNLFLSPNLCNFLSDVILYIKNRETETKLLCF